MKKSARPSAPSPSSLSSSLASPSKPARIPPSPSSTSSTAKTIKLRLIAWDPKSKSEICSYQNAPTLDLTLKVKKKWSDVVQYLLKKWGDVHDLQQRLQIFLLSPNQPNQKNKITEMQGTTVDCLTDLSRSVGQSVSCHPSFLLSSLEVPVIELFYHLRSPSPRPSSFSSSVPLTSNSFASTDPTLDAFCEMGEFFDPPTLLPPCNRHPQYTSSYSGSRIGKRSPPEEDRTMERSVRQKQPESNFQPRPLEILNLPLFLNKNTPPMAMSHSDQDDAFHTSVVDDFPRESDSVQLAFIRDGLQAIVDSPLSSLPPLDSTLEPSTNSFKMFPSSSPVASSLFPHQTYDPNLHHEMPPQFSSDTIAHLIDVMKDTDTSVQLTSPTKLNEKEPVTTTRPHSPNPASEPSALLNSIAASFKTPLETIPEKNSGSCYSPTSNFPSSSCESDSELSNSAAKRHALFLPSRPRPSSPDQSSQLSLVESETIQDSDGDAHCQSKVPSHSHTGNGVSSTEIHGSGLSHLSIGIPKEIMRANRRKPHLRRINPTLVGPLVSSPQSKNGRDAESWG
jgi:hypothetical protein